MNLLKFGYKAINRNLCYIRGHQDAERKLQFIKDNNG